MLEVYYYYIHLHYSILILYLTIAIYKNISFILQIFEQKINTTYIKNNHSQPLACQPCPLHVENSHLMNFSLHKYLKNLERFSGNVLELVKTFALLYLIIQFQQKIKTELQKEQKQNETYMKVSEFNKQLFLDEKYFLRCFHYFPSDRSQFL